MKNIEELYFTFNKDVYNYLLWLTKNHFLSEDLMQETFLQTINSLNKFKGGSSLKTWIFSIARHLWLNHLRKSKEYPEDFAQLDLIDIANTEVDFFNNEKMKLIYELISKESEQSQKIISMRIEGFSFSEIADCLKISEGSARIILHRCRNSIKNNLKEMGHND